MDVKTALETRKSVRSFKNKDVTLNMINNILEEAKCAPSGVNSQPWKIAVVKGGKKNELQEKIEGAFRSGIKPQMEYNYYPTTWEGAYKTRRKECGLLMYQALNISIEDKKRRLDQWAANYRAFDAPVMLIFFLDNVMDKGSYLDYGMFIQSIMLSAVAKGLATCPQAALGEYPDIVKETLDYKDVTVLCGMSIGYENPDHPINNYRTPREPLQALVRYFE